MMDSTRVAHQLREAQRSLYQNKVGDALKIAEDVLAQSPDHAEALYIKAVSLRYLKKPDAASGVLDTLISYEPEFGRAHQEKAHLLLAAGDKTAALASYRLACANNPALLASWKMQAALLTELGRADEAKAVNAQALRLAHLPKDLLAVSHLIHEHKLLKAEKLCRKFLLANPHHIEAMRLLADIGLRLSAFEEAEFLLESALEFAPDNVQIRLDYIAALRKRQKYGKALVQAQTLQESDPENPVFQSHYATTCLQADDLETALRMFDKVLEKLPEDAATLTSKGHVLKTIGRQEAAIASYRRAVKAKADHGDAFHALANLKTYRFLPAEHNQMLAQVAAPFITETARIQLCFALGKSFDDLEDYQQAFQFYARGNDLKRKQSRYSAASMQEEFDAQKTVCTRALFETFKGCGYAAPDPIFIVGLPRAGSTLLEQILASHSQVDGTLELPNIIALSNTLRSRKHISAADGYPYGLKNLSPEQLFEFGKKYIDDTAMYRKGAPFFVDKMPNNFRHIGLIQLILPNARIIDVRRNPMDCCFSGFKQLFAEGQEFTYGLREVGKYYRGYVELMKHWDEAAPNEILHVQYEDVVDDLEGQVHRVLEYCGLPFEAACLEFHNNERAVRTASSEQVREKINRKGLAQWWPYEAWLEPLRNALKGIDC